MLSIMLRGPWALLVFVIEAAGCGGATVSDPDGAAGGARATGARAGRDGGTEAPAIWDGGGDIHSEYVEPTCPDAGPPPVTNECDPFDPRVACPLGWACYPFVTYPDGGDPCAREQYGAECLPEGRGTQGEACSSSLCSAGFACVVTGQGTQCAQLCRISSPGDCPRGLLCITMDVEPGVGSCI
jgi:hypothetical protein